MDCMTLSDSFFGREEKTKEISMFFNSDKDNAALIYGRRRVGRLIMFKECLKNNIVPFILGEDLKLFYYRGLKEWKTEKGYLTDTILTAQDRFKLFLDYFKIKYK